jgi:hypothetical protein
MSWYSLDKGSRRPVEEELQQDIDGEDERQLVEDVEASS